MSEKILNFKEINPGVWFLNNTVMGKLGLFIVMLAFMLGSCGSAKPVVALSEEQIAQALADQTYQFNAQMVTPLGGRQRTLTGGYNLKVTKQVITAELPYFGKAYTAQIGSTDVGIKFSSKDFSYETIDGKKGSKDIHIKPKDFSDIQELILTVYPDGTAYLRVNSISRQAISYTGDITRPREVKSAVE